MHQKIQPFFKKYADEMIRQSILPDTRKNQYQGKYSQHFIDIDYYSDCPFNKLPIQFEEAAHKFTADTILKYCILPWRVERGVDSLSFYTRKVNTLKIARWVAFPGHYVAYAHQPLHTTINYNGQLTRNDGIHFRYEKGMGQTLIEGYRLQ